MNEAIIILLNMRGGCATVGNQVHTLFRVNNRRRVHPPRPTENRGAQVHELPENPQ